MSRRPQTPGGAGPSQPFRALEFDDPTPRAVVPRLPRSQLFSVSESNNDGDEDMSDSDPHVYSYTIPPLSPDELSRDQRLTELLRPRSRPASITGGRRNNPRTDRRPPPPPPIPEIPREMID